MNKFFNFPIKIMSTKIWLIKHQKHKKRRIEALDNGYGLISIQCLDCNEVLILDEITNE